MIKTSDTPRTDSVASISYAYDEKGYICATSECVDAEFARELEREINELKTEHGLMQEAKQKERGTNNE